MPCRIVYIFLKRNFFEKYCLLCFDIPRPAASADFFWIFRGGRPSPPRIFFKILSKYPPLVFQDFHKKGGVFQVLSPDNHYQRRWRGMSNSIGIPIQLILNFGKVNKCLISAENLWLVRWHNPFKFQDITSPIFIIDEWSDCHGPLIPPPSDTFPFFILGRGLRGRYYTTLGIREWKLWFMRRKNYLKFTNNY